MKRHDASWVPLTCKGRNLNIEGDSSQFFPHLTSNFPNSSLNPDYAHNHNSSPNSLQDQPKLSQTIIPAQLSVTLTNPTLRNPSSNPSLTLIPNPTPTLPNSKPNSISNPNPSQPQLSQTTTLPNPNSKANPNHSPLSNPKPNPLQHKLSPAPIPQTSTLPKPNPNSTPNSNSTSSAKSSGLRSQRYRCIPYSCDWRRIFSTTNLTKRQPIPSWVKDQFLFKFGGERLAGFGGLVAMRRLSPIIAACSFNFL